MSVYSVFLNINVLAHVWFWGSLFHPGKERIVARIASASNSRRAQQPGFGSREFQLLMYHVFLCFLKHSITEQDTNHTRLEASSARSPPTGWAARPSQTESTSQSSLPASLPAVTSWIWHDRTTLHSQTTLHSPLQSPPYWTQTPLYTWNPAESARAPRGPLPSSSHSTAGCFCSPPKWTARRSFARCTCPPLSPAPLRDQLPIAGLPKCFAIISSMYRCNRSWYRRVKSFYDHQERPKETSAVTWRAE